VAGGLAVAARTGLSRCSARAAFSDNTRHDRWAALVFAEYFCGAVYFIFRG